MLNVSSVLVCIGCCFCNTVYVCRYEDDVDELMHFAHSGIYSRAQMDDSVFSVDYPRAHLTHRDHFSPERSSIVLCNPVARGSSGSLPQSGSEAHDVDSLSSDCMSPLESSLHPTSSALELSSSVSHAFFNGHLSQRFQNLSHSQSSPTLDRYFTSSPVPSCDPTFQSDKHGPHHLEARKRSALHSVPASSPVVTVITPASPDMRHRNESQSSLLRMKGSLDLRSSSEEDISSLDASPEDMSYVHVGDSTDGRENKSTFHGENVKSEEESDLENARNNHGKVPGHHQFPWQNTDYDWRGDVDLLEQETLV